MTITNARNITIVDPRGDLHRETRREFLKLASFAGAALFLPNFITGCSEGVIDPSEKVTINLGNDTGVLNFIFVFEQMQLDFYQRVGLTPYAGMTQLESSAVFAAGTGRIMAQHSNRRTVFPRIIGAGSIPNALYFDFSSLDFSKKSVILPFAIAMEDAAAATYHGLMSYVTSSENLTYIGKIASVEARHSAALRDMSDIASGDSDTANRVSFAGTDVVPLSTGLNKLITPSEALTFMDTYVTTELNVQGL